MKKVVIITGSELRHTFLRMIISSDKNINSLNSFCESQDGNLNNIVENQIENKLRTHHLNLRKEVEKEFFENYCLNKKDLSNPIFIRKGEINNESNVNHIIELNPDIIISFGCSIIKSKLLDHFKNRFINIHLGLSPYYRGSGTNFWPFVNNELQFVGTTFMYIDKGIDTGQIIHQIRAKINLGDNIHRIGYRLIFDSSMECIRLINKFKSLKKFKTVFNENYKNRYYGKKDFSEDSVLIMKNNFENNLIKKYLENMEYLNKKFPIFKNPVLIK